MMKPGANPRRIFQSCRRSYRFAVSNQQPQCCYWVRCRLWRGWRRLTFSLCFPRTRHRGPGRPPRGLYVAATNRHLAWHILPTGRRMPARPPGRMQDIFFLAIQSLCCCSTALKYRTVCASLVSVSLTLYLVLHIPGTRPGECDQAHAQGKFLEAQNNSACVDWRRSGERRRQNWRSTALRCNIHPQGHGMKYLSGLVSGAHGARTLYRYSILASWDDLWACVRSITLGPQNPSKGTAKNQIDKRKKHASRMKNTPAG
jgi:hypothetical protein